MRLKDAAQLVADAMPITLTGGQWGNCVSSNLLGQELLAEHCGIRSTLVVGDFALSTSPRAQDTLAFGNPVFSAPLLNWGDGGFKGHAWLTVGDRIVDFAWSGFRATVEAQADWLWSIPDTNVFVGKSATRSQFTRRENYGMPAYREWPYEKQQDVIARLVAVTRGEQIYQLMRSVAISALMGDAA